MKSNLVDECNDILKDIDCRNKLINSKEEYLKDLYMLINSEPRLAKIELKNLPLYYLLCTLYAVGERADKVALDSLSLQDVRGILSVGFLYLSFIGFLFVPTLPFYNLLIRSNLNDEKRISERKAKKIIKKIKFLTANNEEDIKYFNSLLRDFENCEYDLYDDDDNLLEDRYYSESVKSLKLRKNQ